MRAAALASRRSISLTRAAILGLMLASAFISMWVSNTATAVIMVPIGLSILQLVTSLDDRVSTPKLGASILLGIAYAVTIGSMATLIGQPPMALMKAYLAEQHGIEVGFGQWMLVGVPFAAVMLVVSWLVLTRLVFRSKATEIPGGRALIRSELDGPGPLSSPERSVLLVFAAAAFGWIVIPIVADIPAISSVLPWLGNISETSIAIAVSCAFMLPVATPSNAVAFATGELPIHRMIRAGIWLNLIGLVLISLALYTLVPWVFGVHL